MSERIGGIDPLLPLATRLEWAQQVDLQTWEALSRQQIQESTDRIHRAIIPFVNESGMSFYEGVLFIHSTHVSGHEHLLLNQQQAAEPFYQRFETLGGVVRSADTPGLATGVYEPADPQAGRPERVQLFQAPLGFETPALLARLANTADKLFPLDHANPVVTPGNIY